MKYFFSSFWLIPQLLFVSLWCQVPDAGALSISSTSAELIIDWNSSGFTWNGSYSGSGADAKYNDVIDSDYTGWPGGIAGPVEAKVTANAIGTATSSSTSVAATGYAKSDETSTGETSGSGTSHIRNNFEVGEQGFDTFTINYTFEYMLNYINGGQLGDSAGGGVRYDFSLWDDSLNSSSNQIELFVFEITENSASNIINATLTVNYSFNPGQLYSLEGHVYSSAYSQAPFAPATPVPEPTTMLLFGTGLAGLTALGRRKKAC